MKRNLFFAILFGIVSTLSWSQVNHIVILTKRDIGGQVFTSSKQFPKKWIEDQWNLSYNIHTVNFKAGEWFVVMNKKGGKKQYYTFNPSNDLIKERLQDGYNIQDITPYWTGSKFGRLYVFTKNSTNPQRQYYFAGQAGMYGSKPWKTLADQSQNCWDKNFLVDNARSLSVNGKTHIALFSMSNNSNLNQISRYRTDFPTDLLQNKMKQGYFLSSITYDGYKGKWFVIMTKFNSFTPWTWMNSKSQMDKIKEYMANGYTITGVH